MISISDKRRMFGSDIDSIDSKSRRLTRNVFALEASAHPDDWTSPITAARIAPSVAALLRMNSGRVKQSVDAARCQRRSEVGRASLPKLGQDLLASYRVRITIDFGCATRESSTRCLFGQIHARSNASTAALSSRSRAASIARLWRSRPIVTTANARPARR